MSYPIEPCYAACLAAQDNYKALLDYFKIKY